MLAFFVLALYVCVIQSQNFNKMERYYVWQTVDVLTTNWGEYTFYQASTRNQGILLALPFVLNGDLKGYLFYSDVNSFPMSDKELFKFGIDSIVHANIGGIVGKLSPLPYNPVDGSKVLYCLKEIVSKNCSVNLGSKLYL